MPRMMKSYFDCELIGADGVTLPVYCEIQPPYVGGQKSLIRLAVPAQHVAKNPPANPCTVSGKSSDVTVFLKDVHWRHFPISSKSHLGLEDVELLHVGRLTVVRPARHSKREIRLHLTPISYLRSEASCVRYGNLSSSEELFALDLPNLGVTSFVAEWVTIYHRDTEIPGATIIAGFSAVLTLPSDYPIDPEKIATEFKSSLEILSVLFRQAVSLQGWTYTDKETISTWIAPLEPNFAPSAREHRGDFVAKPQVFVECAASLARSYETAEKKTRSLVRHLLLVVNPYNVSRTADRFLFMFSALERVIDFAWKRDRTPQSPTATTEVVIAQLEQLQKKVLAEGWENSSEVSQRLGGLITVVDRPSVRDKFEAFNRVYPAMRHYCADLWPVLGSEKERGLREVRNALAHGRSSFVSTDVLAVAEWHLAILLERVIFVLLGMTVPDGISPGSLLLRTGGRGWYEMDRWNPLRSKPDQSI